MSTYVRAARFRDRVLGAMIGAAIGDALGSAFEFVDSASIVRHLGNDGIVRDYEAALSGSLLAPRAPGKPTDDTAMALCVAGVIASSDEPTASAFATSFTTRLRHGSRSRVARMFWTGGPGGATTRALSRLAAGADPSTCGAPNDGGNGAAMRAHPVAMLVNRTAALRVAALQARVTHGHPSAVEAACAVVAIVWDAVRLDAFADVTLSANLPEGITDPTFVRAWETAHAVGRAEGDALPMHLRDVGMSGWETVAAAHAIAMRYPDPIEAIGRAAASGGDTDTIASIVGAIVGARDGLSHLPERLVDRLDDGGLVLEAAEAIAASGSTGFFINPRAADVDTKIHRFAEALSRKHQRGLGIDSSERNESS